VESDSLKASSRVEMAWERWVHARRRAILLRRRRGQPFGGRAGRQNDRWGEENSKSRVESRRAGEDKGRCLPASISSGPSTAGSAPTERRPSSPPGGWHCAVSDAREHYSRVAGRDCCSLAAPALGLSNRFGCVTDKDCGSGPWRSLTDPGNDPRRDWARHEADFFCFVVVGVESSFFVCRRRNWCSAPLPSRTRLGHQGRFKRTLMPLTAHLRRHCRLRGTLEGCRSSLALWPHTIRKDGTALAPNDRAVVTPKGLVVHRINRHKVQRERTLSRMLLRTCRHDGDGMGRESKTTYRRTHRSALMSPKKKLLFRRMSLLYHHLFILFSLKPIYAVYLHSKNKNISPRRFYSPTSLHCVQFVFPSLRAVRSRFHNLRRLYSPTSDSACGYFLQRTCVRTVSRLL
jgi:hypothetical protein